MSKVRHNSEAVWLTPRHNKQPQGGQFDGYPYFLEGLPVHISSV